MGTFLEIYFWKKNNFQKKSLPDPTYTQPHVMIQKENDPFLFDLKLPWKGNRQLTKHLRLRALKREVIGVMKFCKKKHVFLCANIQLKIVPKTRDGLCLFAKIKQR